MRFPRSPRISSLTVLSVAVLALLALAGPASAANGTVTVSNDRFTDSASGNGTSTIAVGDSITWVWAAGSHSSTSGTCAGGCTPDGLWDSGIKSSGQFVRTFATAGTFNYFCLVHGSMMQGKVIVQATTAVPLANFTFSPSGPVMGGQVHFTDSSTGAPTSWSWNFGDPASGTNNTSTQQNPVHTFQSFGVFNVTLVASNAGGPSLPIAKPVTVSAGGAVPCVPSDTTLCLNNGRFAVTADWTKEDTTTGHGTGVKLTSDSGYFYFFDSANIEVVLKVLNGCGINNSYWVFGAGLTNVRVDLKAVDTQTGITYTQVNPLNTAFAPIQDTGAFPTSCP
jgi:PKD repeat protein